MELRNLQNLQMLGIYQCPVCETLVEVLDPQGVELVCCGPPLVKVVAKRAQAGWQDHMPIIARAGREVRVNIGQFSHPMTSRHYVKWIEIVTDGKSARQLLNPGDPPRAIFETAGDEVFARAFCSRHGLWGPLQACLPSRAVR